MVLALVSGRELIDGSYGVTLNGTYEGTSMSCDEDPGHSMRFCSNLQMRMMSFSRVINADHDYRVLYFVSRQIWRQRESVANGMVRQYCEPQL